VCIFSNNKHTKICGLFLVSRDQYIGVILGSLFYIGKFFFLKKNRQDFFAFQTNIIILFKKMKKIRVWIFFAFAFFEG